MLQFSTMLRITTNNILPKIQMAIAGSAAQVLAASHLNAVFRFKTLKFALTGILL